MAEKSLLLQILDHLWKEHLLQLDHLRQGIHLRGYGQRDPLNEYKREAFDLFEAHADQPAPDGDAGPLAPGDSGAAAAGRCRRGGRDPGAPGHGHRPRPAGAGRGPAQHGSRTVAAGRGGEQPRPPSSWGKVPRNAPCPCGSGKKYKHCHGRLT